MTAPLDPSVAIAALRPELEKLPRDKRLHFSGSYMLGLASEPFEDLGPSDLVSSWSILKAVLEAFQTGVAKELGDCAIKKEEADRLLAHLDDMVEALDDLRKGALDLSSAHHETDLLADLAGACSFGVSRALTVLGLHLHEEET